MRRKNQQFDSCSMLKKKYEIAVNVDIKRFLVEFEVAIKLKYLDGL